MSRSPRYYPYPCHLGMEGHRTWERYLEHCGSATTAPTPSGHPVIPSVLQPRPLPSRAHRQNSSEPRQAEIESDPLKAPKNRAVPGFIITFSISTLLFVAFVIWLASMN